MDRIAVIKLLVGEGFICEYELGDDMAYLELENDEFMIFDTSDETWFVVSLSDEISLTNEPKVAMYGALACNSLNTYFQDCSAKFTFVIEDEDGVTTARFTQTTAIPKPNKQSVSGLSEMIKSAISVKKSSAKFLHTFVSRCESDSLTLDDCFFCFEEVSLHPLLQSFLEEYSQGKDSDC